MSTDQTPALARATKAIHDVECGCEYDGDHSDEEIARWGAAARAAASAALHDPDHRGWLAEAMYREDYPVSDRAWEDLNAVTHCCYNLRADAVRAAILGATS